MAVSNPGQLHFLKRGSDPFFHFLRREFQIFQSKAHFLFDRVGENLVIRVLGDKTNPLGQVTDLIAGDIPAEDVHPPLSGRE